MSKSQWRHALGGVGNWCTHDTGANQGLQKELEKLEKEGVCGTVIAVSQVRNRAAALSSPFHFHFLTAEVSVNFCAFLLFSLPSVHNSLALLSFL